MVKEHLKGLGVIMAEKLKNMVFQKYHWIIQSRHKQQDDRQHLEQINNWKKKKNVCFKSNLKELFTLENNFIQKISV